MCVVNLGEVAYIVERERGLLKAQETLARVNEFSAVIVMKSLNLSLRAPDKIGAIRAKQSQKVRMKVTST